VGDAMFNVGVILMERGDDASMAEAEQWFERPVGRAIDKPHLSQ
jgi:hypothetical protein